ncbi:MAG: argininosuccinate lyase [Oscillospiraceae bacterium]|jgi:argininosuccinate lyase|nr:argininosuccinate lyase [Oscillospiraceae bacterium]
MKPAYVHVFSFQNERVDVGIAPYNGTYYSLFTITYSLLKLGDGALPKIWSGRTHAETAELTDRLNYSIDIDKRLYREDIRGSIVHAGMLAKQGILTETELNSIVGGLETIRDKFDAGTQRIPDDAEDIHMAIETLLTEKIGSPGKRLHTARSRNDQVATDFKLYLKEECKRVQLELTALLGELCSKARTHLNTVMPAYTHMQRAQPSTYAHYLMAYAQMFRRDYTRLSDLLERMDECPLGAGALCGTSYDIDREYTARELGFRAPTQNSIDSVSDRDYAVELLAALSLIQTHLSRFSEEIILWCNQEFRFIEIGDAYTTGSSMMPQKKNPDVAELIRGKTGRVYGDLTALLTVLKGLPLAYNKDMQEDKEAVFDALDTVLLCLEAFTAMLASVKVNTVHMRNAAADGFINATDCADYLVARGLPFRDAYAIVGHLVSVCVENVSTLENLPLDVFKNFSELFERDVYDVLNIENCVNRRGSEGGPSPVSVQKQIEAIEAFIGDI